MAWDIGELSTNIESILGDVVAHPIFNGVLVERMVE